MGDAHRRIGGVDRLAAGARRAVDVDPQVLVVDPHVHLLRLGQYRDRGGGGVDASPALGDGHALDAVHAGFKLEPGEHALASDRGDHLLIPAELGGGRAHELGPPALLVGIALVHAEQVAREQSRLVAAGAGADLEDGGARVGGVAGEQSQRQRAVGAFQCGLNIEHLFRGELSNVLVRALNHVLK